MSLSRRCAWCQVEDESLLSCKQCQQVAYCGRECQVSHWKNGHKASCNKTQTLITFMAGKHKPAAGDIGDSTPENISMALFVKMSKPDQEKAVVKFAKATKSIRHYTETMVDSSLRWAAVSVTTRLVLMDIYINNWDRAHKRLCAFFRLVERLQCVEPSPAQCEEWGLDIYVSTMAQNHCVVREMLLEAEFEITSKRVWILEPGHNKSEQTYALVERVMLSQKEFVKLGPHHVEMNVYYRIEMIVLCISLLVDLDCTKDAIDNGVVLDKTFRMLDYQVALGFTILKGAKEHYPQRADQFSMLQEMEDIVERMKVRVGRGRLAEFIDIRLQALVLVLEDSDSDIHED